MTTEIVLYITLGTVLAVLFVVYWLLRPVKPQELIELELAIYKEWESTMTDLILLYEPKDVFGRPFPIGHALACAGQGWAGLIRECYQICVETGTDISQIKEKFGGLRFYVGGSTKEALDRIEDICESSYGICENCGRPGELDTNRSWYKTLCEACDGVSRIDMGHELYHLLPLDAVKEAKSFLSPDLPTKKELE